jgi:Protein of unknown function (DUF3619)
MNEMQFGSRIRQLLNRGLQQDGGFKQAHAKRLRAARLRALERQRTQPAFGLVWADSLLGRFGGWSGVSLRLLAPLTALAVALAAVYTWQQNQRVAELEEIDAQLLTDELPIDAYLDRGFQNWLKKRSAEE